MGSATMHLLDLVDGRPGDDVATGERLGPWVALDVDAALDVEGGAAEEASRRREPQAAVARGREAEIAEHGDPGALGELTQPLDALHLQADPRLRAVSTDDDDGAVVRQAAGGEGPFVLGEEGLGGLEAELQLGEGVPRAGAMRHGTPPR